MKKGSSTESQGKDKVALFLFASSGSKNKLRLLNEKCKK
jgi:hypothetical protein